MSRGWLEMTKHEQKEALPCFNFSVYLAFLADYLGVAFIFFRTNIATMMQTIASRSWPRNRIRWTNVSVATRRTSDTKKGASAQASIENKIDHAATSLEQCAAGQTPAPPPIPFPPRLPA